MALSVESVAPQNATTTGNKCIVLGPKTSYSLPIDMVASGLAGAQEIWIGFTYDFRAAAGGFPVTEITSSNTPNNAFWAGLRSAGTALPTALSSNSEWFAGLSSYNTDNPTTLAVTCDPNARLYGNLYFSAVVHSKVDNMAMRRTSGGSYSTVLSMTSNANTIATPTSLLTCIIRIVRTGAGFYVYSPAGIVDDMRVNDPSVATLTSIIDAKAANPWLGDHVTYYTNLPPNWAPYPVVSAGLNSATDCAFFLHNPFVSNSLRLHALVIKKVA